MLKISNIRGMCFVVIFSFLSFFNFYIHAQTVDETIKLADELYKSGDFNNSLQLYNRILFFSKKNKQDIYKRAGDCCFYLNDFKHALNYYDSTLTYCNSDEFYNEIIFKKADCYIISKDYQASLFVIEELKITNEDELQIKKNFYRGITYFATADFEKSKLYFLEAVDDTSIDAKNEIYHLFEKKRYLNSPNPEPAGILSSLFPGAGQLYSGDYKNAINSFLLISFFIVAGTDMYLRYGLIDPVISISPWLNRYYKGGCENAKLTAQKKRDQKRNEILNEIIDIINKN